MKKYDRLVKEAQKHIHGVTFRQTLTFGEWPVEKVEEVISDLRQKHDLRFYELDYVSRGGYAKCQGYGNHKACDELLTTNGQIVFKVKENLSADDIERLLHERD